MAGTSRTSASICAWRTARPMRSRGVVKRQQLAAAQARAGGCGDHALNLPIVPATSILLRLPHDDPAISGLGSRMRRNRESQLARSVIEPPVDQVVIIARQLARQFADLEVPRAGRLNERHFGGDAGDEHLLEAFQLLRPDRPLDHLDAAAPGQVHHRPAGDAVEEAVGRRRVELAVADEEGVGAGRLGHLAAPVEHQRVVIAALVGMLLRQRGDHVEAGRLAMHRRGVGRRPAPRRDVEAQALGRDLGREIFAPFPGGDGHMRLGALAADTPICSDPRQATGRT